MKWGGGSRTPGTLPWYPGTPLCLARGCDVLNLPYNTLTAQIRTRLLNFRRFVKMYPRWIIWDHFCIDFGQKI